MKTKVSGWFKRNWPWVVATGILDLGVFLFFYERQGVTQKTVPVEPATEWEAARQRREARRRLA